MPVLVNGSAAFDTVITPYDHRERVLGGSAVYAATSVSLFSRAILSSIVGGDWLPEHTEFLRRCGVDPAGLDIQSEGKTLYWSGEYFGNMDDRRTLEIQPNVCDKNYLPDLSPACRSASVVLLANGAPATHLEILRQMTDPKLVIADTMDFYITGQRAALDQLLSQIHGLVVNESEIRLLTGENDLIKAAEKGLEYGPQFLIVKRGASGAFFLSRQHLFVIPAYPLCRVVDPTGAGDSFVGAFTGCLAEAAPNGMSDFTAEVISNALMIATVTASFCVEGFSLERLASITSEDVQNRVDRFRKMLCH